MKDYAELEMRLQDASLEHQNRFCDVLLEEAAAAISDLTKRLEEARAVLSAVHHWMENDEYAGDDQNYPVDSIVPYKISSQIEALLSRDLADDKGK